MSDALYNHCRHIRGGGEPIRVPATVAAEIKVGDLLVLTSNKAIRASSLGDSGTKAQNQEAAHDVFLGSSLDEKLTGETRDILIQPDGEHCYPCAALAQAYDPGTLVGMAGTGASGAVGVADQEVEVVATANLAIGRMSRTHAAGATKIYFFMASVLGTPFSGPQAMA